jgi:hypothetical protein
MRTKSLCRRHVFTRICSLTVKIRVSMYCATVWRSSSLGKPLLTHRLRLRADENILLGKMTP